MAKLSLFPLVLLFIHLSPATYANDHKHNGLSFRLVHRNSLSIPSSNYNLTVEQELERFIQPSDARVDSDKHLIMSRNSTLSKANDQPIKPYLHHHSRQSVFLIEMGIGTFMGGRHLVEPYYLELDTASGPIWTQCQGCNPCFHQKGPVFPQSRSSSYRQFHSRHCPLGATSEQDHCRDDISYVDGTTVQGIAATETFTFPQSGGGATPMQQVRFTCAIRAQNFVLASDRENNIASGVFGMSPHSSSFMSQMGSYLGGRFSYCFTQIYHVQEPDMYLRFGDDIPPISSLYQHTQLTIGRSKYYLNLQAISVGSERLNINPSVFERRIGSEGCYIDTGATASRLVEVAYREFERVLKQTVIAANPGITPFYRGPSLCFKQPRPFARTQFPNMTYHFADDANFVVDKEFYVLGFESPRPQVYCLMIIPDEMVTVLGAYQQVNHRIIYDTVRSQLHFARANCGSDN